MSRSPRASRRGATVRGVPFLRRLTALGVVMLFKTIHPVRGVWDYTCGYRAYRIGLLQDADRRFGGRLIEETGFACMVEALLKLNAMGARFAEVGLHLRYDLKPTESKMACRAAISAGCWRCWCAGAGAVSKRREPSVRAAAGATRHPVRISAPRGYSCRARRSARRLPPARPRAKPAPAPPSWRQDRLRRSAPAHRRRR